MFRPGDFSKRKRLQLITDLTQGKPGKVLCRFAIPMLVSVAFQQLYNIADSMIAGKYAGEDALAAVGASYPITMIFMAIAVGSNIGCSVVVSGFFGARDLKSMKTAVTTTFSACAAICVLLTGGGLARQAKGTDSTAWHVVVTGQDIAAGTQVERGTTVTVLFADTSDMD